LRNKIFTFQKVLATTLIFSLLLAYPLLGFVQSYASDTENVSQSSNPILNDSNPSTQKKHNAYSVVLSEKIGIETPDKKSTKKTDSDSNLQQSNGNSISKHAVHYVVLAEKIGLSDNNQISNPAYNTLTKIQTSLERIWNFGNLRSDKNKASFMNQLLNSYDHNYENSNLIINEKQPEILLIERDGKFVSSNLLAIFPSQPSKIESEKQLPEFLVTGQTDSFLSESASPDNNLTLIILVPLSGFVLLRSENNQIKFHNVQRFTCLIFIIILVSSTFTIPFSISSAYWPQAFAEKQAFDESVSVVPSNDTKVKGKPADTEPKGKPVDSNNPEFSDTVSVVPSNGTSMNPYL